MNWRIGIRTLLLVLLAAGLVLSGQVFNRTQAIQGTEPQWWETLPPAQPGFPAALSGAALIWGSSPTLADLDGNGTLEVIAAGRDLADGNPGCGGMVYAYRHDGSRVWETHVRAMINSTPTTADLTGDGYLDVVVSMGGLTEPQCWHGGVVALDGRTGQQLWTFDTQDWLNHHKDGWMDGVFSTPAIADINRDGQPEIAFGAWDQCIYLLDRNGQPLWGNLPGIIQGTYCGGHGFYNEDTIWSSPALADITGDGRLEIIIGADISQGNWWGDPTGGYLRILDADGNSLAREWMDQAIYSSPAVADLDNDGAYEIVVGTATYLAGKGYYVSAFDYDAAPSDPADRLVLKWRAPTAGRVFASPAIADLNQDGGLDVVSTALIGDWGADGSMIYAWRGSDGAQLFQRRNCNYVGQTGNTLSSPTIADVDGDQKPEILFAHLWEVGILNHDGTYYTDYSNPKASYSPVHPGCARDHAPTTDLSYLAQDSLYSSPAVGDLDGDGDAEIVATGHNPGNHNQGMIFAWTSHSVEHFPAWPTWRHDERHSGNYFFELIPPTNPTALRSSSHTLNAWSTNDKVQMAWGGAKDNESGLAGYSILWDTSPNTLPDTTLDLDAAAQGATSPPLPDGKNNYFHLRTGDKAGNWAADALHYGPFWIDATPPTSSASSPPVVSAPFQVTWTGSDPASGISHYTIQVRDGDGVWTNWLENEKGTFATYQGTEGHTYRFRSIAHDTAGHDETDYTSNGDTSTVMAKYIVSGAVYDQKEQPVANAAVSAEPAALNQAVSDGQGQYSLGIPAGGSYNLTASHTEYGPLPPMQGVSVAADLAGVNFYLPPDPNLIVNGDFEAQGGWQVAGSVPPAPVRGQGHTGDFALKMGDFSVAPTAGFDSSSPDTLGEMTIFSNTSTGDLPLTYLWDFGDGSPGSTASDPTHTYATTGTFAVVLTATNAGGEDTYSDTVEIVDRPQPPVAGFDSSSPDTLGETTTFTNTSTGDLPLTYAWSLGDGITSTLEAPTHTYATSGTFTVILTASNALGSDAYSDTVEIISNTSRLSAAWQASLPAAPTASTWTVSQTVSLPNNAETATLAWIYRVDGTPAADDSLALTVRGPTSDLSQPLSLDKNTWTHGWLDVNGFAGQEVSIVFTLYRESITAPLSVWLDEVTLGTTTRSKFPIYLPLVQKSN